ncbi:SMC family ATPase [Leptolyngbya sp. FACHB-321]|uniref:AAA family ATPase n=1 Tax=Leptolyngbya sp. FACHB-321 TaxID=2692807 RepID=UPI001689FDCC|nr:SMC family ATPase [Leptolyngbya sp. FACHB-321]MBD2037932.1 SMC family ATPase [Leptolyngbya sp. FACHB-321]
MIPLKLVLKNFLSYRNATLDFRGLHTACICGANGAGKSSLLEAIAWAVWGQSRAASEDDVIHIGAQEAQVDFIFSNNQHTYRILRSRYRGQSSSLEFQVAQGEGNGKVEGEKQKVEAVEGAAAAGAEEAWEAEGQGRRVGLSNPRSPFPTPHSLRFRTLTAKGVRATQQLILEHLKLDYETFVNSAYLRQGRADEFMLKRPTERKQILADLLKLEQYDRVADQAKDQSRQFKGQIELLERSLEAMQSQLQTRDRVVAERAALELKLAMLREQQMADSEQLHTLQAMQQQRQTWQQQHTWQQQQQRHLEQDCQRLQQELTAIQQQQQELGALLEQEAAIVAGYRQFQNLQAQEESVSARFKAHQQAQAQRQQYQQQQNERLTEQQRQIQQVQAQLEALTQQDAELQQTLAKAADIAAAVQQLQQARAHLSQLDQRQVQASPLLQRRQVIQSQLDRLSTRLTTRLEELHASAQQLQAQQSCQPQLKQAVQEVSDRIAALDARRAYQERVREKGLERRSFMEQLQEQQRHCEGQLAALEQKMQLLVAEDRGEEGGEAKGKRQKAKGKQLEHEFTQAAESSSVAAHCTTPNASPLPTPHSLLPTPYPPCPLCDRPLDEQHWNLVLEKHQIEQQAVLDQVWVIREQLSASEREIQILRDEYRALERELKPYSAVLERRGQLQEQLQTTIAVQATLQQVVAEAAELERSLQLGNYATELHDELRLLDRSLQELHYDEKDHALARGEVDRWRWAEIRQAEIKQAQRRHDQLSQRQPDLYAQLTELQANLKQLNAETATQLALLDRQIAGIGYELEQHNALRHALREAQHWQLRYQEIGRARQHYPQMQQRVSELAQALDDRQHGLQAAQMQLQQLVQQLERTPDCQAQMQTLEARMQQQRSHLDEQLASLGRLQQQQQQLETLNTQYSALNTQLQAVQRQQRIYQELAQAFGKNGIQALMIENALPQLEAETNQILSRLSANQLHIQFVTQRSNRRDQVRQAKASKARNTLQQSKLIETLDILIADAHGTRPYETYSGGEAFRVNFAIRLALARLLAHRSGTALQMLIVDEGFGTQDAEGCDRLIAAINAIAPDFACILTVTHVPHFKEAFQSRIEVFKTEQGSQVSLVI